MAIAGAPVAGAERVLKILVVDDHPILRDAVRHALADADDLRVVGEAESGARALVLAARTAPDVVLLDLRMPGMDGFECLAELKRRHPEVHVIVLSASSDERRVHAALAAGADAYVVKTVNPLDLAPIIRQTVERSAFTAALPERATAGGATALSPRERTVLHAVASGRSNAEVAQELWVTEGTVKFHLRNVYRKLGVGGRTEAVRYAHQAGLVAAGD